MNADDCRIFFTFIKAMEALIYIPSIKLKCMDALPISTGSLPILLIIIYHKFILFFIKINKKHLSL